MRRHVVLGSAEADAAALWAVATQAFDAFSTFPRLFVTAPEKGCGKSTLLDVLSRLVPRPLSASSITAAALFRTIEAARPTLLLDEADTYARDNEDLRGVLNDGHRRDGFVIRTVGDDHEPRRFSTWAPIALAAIGHLPGTIEDRSIKVILRRRRPDEHVEQLRGGRTGHLHADETRPWPEWRNGKPITERQLAALLKPHEIKPKTVRRGIETEKGYRLDWFAGAFARYLPPRSVTASQSSDSAGFEHFRSVAPGPATAPHVTDARRENTSARAACDGVTDGETPADDDEFPERAAILEYDGGYPRAEAERLARAELDAARRPVH